MELYLPIGLLVSIPMTFLFIKSTKIEGDRELNPVEIGVYYFIIAFIFPLSIFVFMAYLIGNIFKFFLRK